MEERTARFDLRALYETSRLLGSSLELGFVLENLLLSAMSKLLVPRGVVLLDDPLAAGLRVVACRGVRDLASDDVLHLDDGLSDDTVQGSDVPPVLAAHRLALVLPIASGRRRIGLLALGAKMTGEPFAEEELEFIRSLVGMSAAAVHNALMVEELQQANRDLDGKVQALDTLFDLSQEFNASLDPDRVARLLQYALMGQLLVGKYLFLLQPRAPRAEGPALEVASARGFQQPTLPEATLNALCGLGQVALLGEDEHAEAEAWKPLRERGLALAMPIRQGDATCAVLCLGPKMTGKPYEPGDVDFLSALGHMAYVSIQNAYLVEEQIEKERLEQELELARSIQQRLLPDAVGAVGNLDLAAVARPSRHVGGDYYDVIDLGGGRCLLAIADVTGKGVPAALLMANIQSCLHVLAPGADALAEAAARINKVVCRNTDFATFITFFVALAAPGEPLRYVNAGHNPPMLVREDGTVEELETGGLLLGVLSGATYAQGTVNLAPGDVLALFTDGVTEAMNPNDEEYEEERLRQVLRAHRDGASAQTLLDAVLEDVEAFTAGAPQSDDLTMIVARQGG